jgi:hypothetical protein
VSARAEAEITCDGPDLAVGKFPCQAPPVFGKTAAEARVSARHAGWRTGIYIVRPGSPIRGAVRGDQCPECRTDKTPDSRS